jgi:hypothetical protein
LFKRIAIWIDRKACRAVFGAIAVLAAVLLGPFAVILIAIGPREPWLFLFGVGGVVGLIGGSARVWLGPRFFALARWARVVLAVLISAGVAAALLAVFALPGSVYWATVASVVGLAGLILLAGSITAAGPGPNNSFKPNPLRGSA